MEKIEIGFDETTERRLRELTSAVEMIATALRRISEAYAPAVVSQDEFKDMMEGRR
jgi:hypothetical protein